MKFNYLNQQEMNFELYARVKILIAEQTWVSEELTPDTHLADDLGIVGDDGYELLEAFCEEFEIQNTCEIDPYEYFGPEGWNPLYIYVLLYYLAFNREKINEPGWQVDPVEQMKPVDWGTITYYGLTPEGGAQWEAFAAPDWQRYIDASSRLTDDGKGIIWEVICVDKKWLEAYFKSMCFYDPQDVSLATVEWDYITPWDATYWK